MPGERFAHREVYDAHEEELHTGHKHEHRSCVECGATKTPQWREGPLGPKTLCNACGVKRARKRKRTENRESKKTSGAAAEELLQNLHTVEGFRESRRKPYATIEPEQLMLQRHALSSNSDASYHQYEAEEVSKAQNRRARLRDYNNIPELGSEYAAAVDLLSMSQGRRAEPQPVAQQLQPQVLDETNAAIIASNSLRNTLSTFDDFSRTSDFINQSLPNLSTEKQEEWWALKHQMDGIFQESASADPAVAAVAKVLAFKQAEAMETRVRVQAKAASLYPYVKQIEEACMRANAQFRQG